MRRFGRSTTPAHRAEPDDFRPDVRRPCTALRRLVDRPARHGVTDVENRHAARCRSHRSHLLPLDPHRRLAEADAPMLGPHRAARLVTDGPCGPGEWAVRGSGGLPLERQGRRAHEAPEPERAGRGVFRWPGSTRGRGCPSRPAWRGLWPVNRSVSAPAATASTTPGPPAATPSCPWTRRRCPASRSTSSGSRAARCLRRCAGRRSRCPTPPRRAGGDVPFAPW